ncbi:MAG: hypothetical protein ACR2NZ_08605 [Rubripirellula sp.]
MPEIHIHSTSSELVPGQTCRIPIEVVIEQPLKVRGLHATFHGAEETQATFSTYNAATKSTQTQTTFEHFDIVKEEYVLSGREQKGFFGNVADGLATLVGSGEHDVLDPGSYSFEVDVQVPPEARPSLHGNKCRVFYELSVLIDIPVWRDVKALESFSVSAAKTKTAETQTSVRTRYPEDQGRGLFDSVFGPDVRVEAALAEGLLREGDTVEGMFVVETPKPVPFRAIHARLISVESSTANGHNDSYTHPGEPITIAGEGVIDKKYSQEFQLPVSVPGPKTDQGQNFRIDCFLQIELDVPWAKDPKIRVPVTLI